MGWFTSNNERRIEDIKNEVRLINKNLEFVVDMLDKGRDYCIQNQQEFIESMTIVVQMYERLQQDLQLIPQDKLMNIKVAWHGCLERHPIVFWNMSFMSMMNQISTVIENWGL